MRRDIQLGIGRLAGHLASDAASGASALAEKSTGTTAWLAAIVGASTVTPGGQPCDAHIQVAAEVGSVAVDQDRLTIPLGHATAITPVPSGICSALVVSASCGLDRRDLDPVDVVGPSLAQLVDHPDHILGVLGGLEAEVAVRADRVVGAEHRAGAFLAQIHHRVERRADPPGEAVDVVDLALLALKTNWSTSPGLSMTPFKAIGAVNGVAWAWSSFGSFSMHIAQRRQPEAVGIRGDPLGILALEAELAVEARPAA